jgi:hypothetical protein
MPLLVPLTQVMELAEDVPQRRLKVGTLFCVMLPLRTRIVALGQLNQGAARTFKAVLASTSLESD